MTRSVIILLMASLCLSLISAAPTGAAEMRGLWVDAFHPGFRTPEETTTMVAKAKDCGFNTLFVQVRRRGDVCYNSATEPKMMEIAPDYDALADVVKKAHAAGLRVHAWVSALEVFHETKWRKPSADSVHIKHADWLMKDHRGQTKLAGDVYYLDPAVPEARGYLVNLVEDLLKRYDVDGIHFDNLKYPGHEGGYGDASLARFKKEMKRDRKPQMDDEDWCNWRRAQMAELVGQVYRKAKTIKPNAQVSAVVLANKRDAVEERFQDWPGWIRSGVMDFVVPMAFQQDLRVFASNTAECLSNMKSGTVYIGQAGWMLSPEDSIRQIAAARQAGAPGIVVYSYWYCSQPIGGAASRLMEALKSSNFAN